MSKTEQNSVPRHKEKLPRVGRTIWSHPTGDLIPERFRRIITVVLPAIYGNFVIFGFLSTLFPTPTFAQVVGIGYGTIWAFLVMLSAAISFVSLAYRLKLEIYSSIILTVLLTIYPFFVAFLIFHDPDSLQLYKFAVVFAVTLYPIMPAWRVVDIVLEIRKSKQRQLYAKAQLGETHDVSDSG